jgi:hypothetical protein
MKAFLKGFFFVTGVGSLVSLVVIVAALLEMRYGKAAASIVAWIALWLGGAIGAGCLTWKLHKEDQE